MASAMTSQPKKFAFTLKLYFLEARPQYLLLPVVLILVGTALAAWSTNGNYNPFYAVIALVGLVLCHMSVNILNDYFDYKSGVDLKTLKTPFSGGSGLLPAGRLPAPNVFKYGLICFILAIPVGVFFTLVQGWELIPLLALGAVCVLMYTSFILKVNFPEWSPGVGLGILPVLGAYFVQTGYYSAEAFIGSIPSGFLVLNLLLLNEFPDVEADKIASRKTLPITMGKRTAAVIYSSFTILTYLWIIGAVLTGTMPLYTLIALATLPFAINAIRGSFHYNEVGKVIPAMGNNVIMVLVTQLLLGIGYILGAVLG